MSKLKTIICVSSMVLVVVLAKHPRFPCKLRETQYGYVCVCTDKYCDTLNGPLPKQCGEYTLVTTSKNKDRFVYKTGKLDGKTKCGENGCATLDLDPSKTFQTMRGFGGAYTGSVTHLVKNLPANMERCFYRSYFSLDDGMGYFYLRIPIGGSDFDFTPWAYNEYPEHDTNLSNFTKLDPRDLERNMQLKKLKEISGNCDIKLLAVSWGPPRWMKEKNEWKGGSDNHLKPEYYQCWADYHVKWLELMKNDGMDIWAISTGNEPSSAVNIPFQTLHWNAGDQAEWIVDYFGPAIKQSKFSNIQIHGFDDNRDLAPAFIDEMEQTDKRSLDYLSGFQFHAYSDKAIEPTILNEFQDRFPDKEIWYTEMCFGPTFMSGYPGPRHGTWGRAQKLTYIIIRNLCHSTVGYIDWNLMLNDEGGPTNFNFIDAPILVNETAKEMYKQPIFYVMAHFSKFIPPGSVRIDANVSGYGSKALRIVAFKRPDKKYTVIVYNNAAKKTIPLTIRASCGKTVIKIKPKSINTLVYLC